MKLVFATNNNNKLKEISDLLDGKFVLLNLKDIGCNEDISENQNTIEGNAKEKALYVYNKYHVNCFADDTGLEIEALNGRPGVLSARYAGIPSNSENNIQKVLKELEGIENRKARFKTVISLIIEGKEKQFAGIVNGMILHEKKGKNGFGYDPIFTPTDNISLSFEEEIRERSFAEMTLEEKNKISHRALAARQLVAYLHHL